MKQYILLIFTIISTGASSQVEWQLARDNKHGKVWVKDFPNSNFKQFKAETTLSATLSEVVALQLDVLNMNKWYDNVGNVTPVQKISDKEGIYIVEFDMPFPVKDRISAIRAKMSYDKEEKIVRVITQYEPNIVQDTKKIHVKNIQSKWLIKDIGNGEIYIFHSGYMDPSGTLPAWIANTGVKDGPIKTFRDMKKVLPSYQGQSIDWL